MATGKDVRCTLHWSEVFLCGAMGVLRKVMMIRDGQGQSAANKPNKWAREIEGNCGELVLAKVLKIPWVPTVAADKTERQPIKRFDVAELQVRTTALPNGCLIVYKGEDPNDKFVLVVGDSPNFRVVGWIRGSDAMDAKYWEEKKLETPAYMVPQYVLHGLDSLSESTSCEEEEELEF